MSALAQKIDKQFDYQRTLYAASGDRMALFVSVDHLALYLAEQMRADRTQVRGRVKAELERRADTGELRRWLEVYGRSHRPERVDHYFLAEQF